MKKSFSIAILSLLFHFIHAQEKSIESLLAELPNLTYEATNEGEYVLMIRQPIDHSNPDKGYFHQRVFLTHRGFDNPTVMDTEGYDLYGNIQSEVTTLLNANQLMIEHRFFGESVPDSMDYRFLNLKQATSDLHNIRQLFSSIYENKWVSTGISKGGATTIAYRYFYPDDVDVSMPYVAPINTQYEEPRIYHFLDTVGTDECRKKIKDFQVKVLENREQIIPLIKYYSLGARAQYTYLSLEAAFEFAVMEYPFAFWQWGAHCDDIPSETASIDEMAEYLITVSNPTFFSDEDIKRYSSHYYQSATEMGYYGYETSEFKDLIKALPTDSNPMALFFPFNMTDPFNGQLLDDINEWLESDANQFIYIYGGQDTWSASAVPPNGKVNAEWFMLKGKHHGNARIKSMTDVEKERLVSRLEEWLDMEIDK